MTPTLSNAIFNETGAWVDLNGTRVNVRSKYGLLAESLCTVTGNREMSQLMNLEPTPEDEEILACDDVRLVELAARYFLWSNSDHGEQTSEPQELLEGAAARQALRGHLRKIWA